MLIGGCLKLGVETYAQEPIQARFPHKKTVTVVNPVNIPRPDALVCIDLTKLPIKSAQNCSFVIIKDGQEIPSQVLGVKLYCVTELPANGRTELTVRYTRESGLRRPYPQRAHAELSPKRGGYFQDKKYIGGDFVGVQFEQVPPEHTDHDTYYRYEGPGWESDRVGYRYYLDWRNRIDIFGKTVRQMVLPRVGLDGFDSYHQMADWGMDIFKVGESIGIGSLALWHAGRLIYVSQVDQITCRITADGPVLAQIQTEYKGWHTGNDKRDLTSFLTIAAGSRLTAHKIRINSGTDTLATGLAKSEGCRHLQSEDNGNGDWRYFALWGLQSLAGDSLGTAVFYRKTDSIKLAEDDLNYLVLLKPTGGELKYYFAAAWEKEPDGITNLRAFRSYLDEMQQLLNNPVKIAY